MTLARLTANAKLVNGTGQVRAAFAGRRGAAFAFSTLADIAPDTHPPDRQRPDRAPAAGAQPGRGADPRGRRLGAGADQPQLRRRQCDRLGPQRLARPRSMRSSAACRSRCSTSFWPSLDLSGLGDRPRRLCVEEQPQRPARPQGPRPQPRRAGARLQADRRRRSRRSSTATRPALRAVAASDGAIVGRAQARFAPLGGGPLVAELMNAPLFAQLRYAGPADTLWRLTGSEVIDMSGPLAVGADIGGRLANPRDPRLAQDRRTRRLESQVTGMVIDHVATPGALLRPAADLQPDHRARPPAAAPSRAAAAITFSGGKTLLNLSFNASQALLLNRDDVAARVTGPLQLKSDAQRRRRFRATSGSTRAASSSAAPAPPPRCRSSTSARPASTRRT